MQKVQVFLKVFSIPIALSAFFLTLLAYRAGGSRAIYVLVLLICVYHVFGKSPFSVLDEGAHFDYVNALHKELRLPLIADSIDFVEMQKLAAEIGTPFFLPDSSFPRYEAVHPPLYYLIGAFVAYGVSLFTDSVAVRFYALRLMSIPFLLLTAWFLKKTYDALVENGAIRKNDFLVFSLAAMFLLSPAFLFVLTPITNDQLLVPLATLFFYLLVSRLPKEKGSAGETALLAVVAGAMVLTKLTSAYLAAFAALILLLRRGPGVAAVYAGLVALIASPWFLFNRINYGAWTGTREHLLFVRPIANPDGSPIPVAHILAKIPEFFAGYLFVPVNKYVPLLAVHFITVTLMAVIVFHITGSGSDLWKRSAPGGKEIWSRFRQLFLISLLLNYIYLIFGTAVTEVWAVYPRYMYMNVTAAVLLTFVFVQRVISRRYVRAVSAGIIVLWAVSLTHYLKLLT